MKRDKNLVASQIAELNLRERRLIRFYMTLPEDQFEKQVQKMANKFFNPNNPPNLKNEYQKENKIIQLAYRAKEYKVPVPIVGGKTRRSKKSRGTRKLKR